MNHAWAAVLTFLLTTGLLAMAQQQTPPAQTSTLKIGDRAPDFTLPDQEGKPVRLSSFAGKQKVVLAFYIKAFTSG